MSPESKKTKNSIETKSINKLENSTSIHTRLEMDSECSLFLNNLKQNNNPNINDVVNGIALILTKMHSNHEEVTNLTKRVNQHDSDIENIKEDVDRNISSISSIQGELNILQQNKIDNEVILCGFPRKLSSDEATQAVFNLCKLLKMDQNCVQHAYSFSSNSTKGKNGYLIIKFVDKLFQIHFIQTTLTNGFPIISQIVADLSKDNSIIRCYGRLTKTNMDIHRELRQLKENKIIEQIRYRNCCFQYKKFNDINYYSLKSLIELNSIKKN